MLRSLLEFTIKPRGHEEAEKELAEVMNLCSKNPSYLQEGEKSEFKNEYDRLQHEIRVYYALKPAARPNNVDMVLRDSRALKSRVKNTIDDRKLAAVIAASTCTAGVYRDVPQEANITSPSAPPVGDPSQRASNHTNEPPNIVTNSPSTPLAGEPPTDNGGRLEPPALPESHSIPAQLEGNLRQAVSLAKSGISYQVHVNSMIMEGSTVRYPTANINSPGSTGATVISRSPQVDQGVPQPARPRRTKSRRIQQSSNFKSFLSETCVSNGSIICRDSRVTGATLNINSVNSSGAVFS